MARTYVVACLVIAMAIPSSLIALEAQPDPNTFESPRGRSEPRFQLGVRTSQRIDDREYYTYTPELGARFLYHYHDLIGLVAGFSYSNLTRLSPRTSFRSLDAEIGFRFRSPEKLFTPIFEAGFAIPTFWGVTNGRRYRETKIGLRFAAGISIWVGKETAIDITVSQVLNHLERDFDEVMDGAPCPPGEPCEPSSYRNPEGAYNTAKLEFLLRFGL